MTIHCSNITLHVGNFTISCPDMVIEPHNITGLIGASGAGKTTLLHILLGLHIPHSGQIFVDGVDITHHAVEKRPMSMVFQDHNIFEHLTVIENIMLGAPKHVNAPDKQQQCDAIMELLHLQHYAKRMPNSLSGGQRSRVALARAFIMARPIMLLDEPFAALDPGLQHDLCHEMIHIAKQQHTNIIFSSHNPLMIQQYCDNFCYMEQGIVKAFDTPNAVLQHNAMIQQYLYGQYQPQKKEVT